MVKMTMSCENCKYVAIDRGASCTYVSGNSGNKRVGWWTAYMCSNPESEYHLALLNVTKTGNQVERVTWGGCNKGVGWVSEAERLLETCLRYQTANTKQT